SLAELADAMSRQGRKSESLMLAPRAGIEHTFRYDAAFAKVKAMVKFPDSENGKFEQRLKLEKSGLFWLDLNGMPITDLSPLAGMSLTYLHVMGTPITDLAPLAGMPLKELNLGGCREISDFRPLAGMPLEILYLDSTRFADLSVLKGMPLRTLM